MKHLLLAAALLFSVLTQAQTFSQVFNQTIPDDGTTVTYNVVVSGLPGIIDTAFGVEAVCVNLNHTWDDDLEVKLKAPDGTIALLFTHVGGDGDNFSTTCLNAGAPTAISAGTAPFNGSYKPMGDLGLVNNGQNPNGIWQLIIRDTYPFADQGYITGWGLTFTSNPAKSFPFFSSNLPIVKINSGNNTIVDEPKVSADFVIIDNGQGVRNYVSDTVYAYKGKMLVEWQGFSGPVYPKKNYDFDLVDAAGTKIDTSLLGMPAENDWILKAEYLDHSLMANPLTYELSRRMGIYAPRTKYCEVMVNGEYVGVYSLTEKVKRGANRLDIAKLSKIDTSGNNLTGGYIIEMNINGDAPAWTSQYQPINYATAQKNVEFKMVYPKIDSVLPVQLNYIHSYVDTFEFLLQNNALFADLWRDYVSEKSFIDFQIVNEFSANYDSYGRSTYLYKDKSKKLHIGPPWDYDRAYASGTQTGWVWLNTHPYWPFPFWWSKMNSDSVYLKKLYCRWASLREDVLSDAAFNTFIDSTSSLLQEAAGRNFTKWAESGVTNYQNPVNDFRSFVTQRLLWMDANIPSYGEFLPQVALVDTSACSGVLVGSIPSSGFSYTWSSGDTTSLLAVQQSGNYQLTVSSDYGCSSTGSTLVNINPSANATFNVQQQSDFHYSFLPTDTTLVNYFWQFGDGFSASLQAPVYTYGSAGVYPVTLTVTDVFGCEYSSTDTLSVIVSGLNTAVANLYTVNPNPFSQYFTIEGGDVGEISVIQFRDVNGSLLLQESNLSGRVVEASKLPSGFYFLSLHTGLGYGQTIKLIKE